MTIKQDKELQRDVNFFYKLFILIKLLFKCILKNIDDDIKVYDYDKSAFDIILPKQKTVFPRHKPIPKSDKQLTRW